MSLKEAIMAIGWKESEAVLIAFLIEHQSSNAEEIIEGTKLSRSTVYKGLKHLINRDYVVKTGRRPVHYSFSPEALSEIKDQFNKFSKKILRQIRPKKIVERRTIIKRISSIFEKNGYNIRDIPRVRKRPLTPHEINTNVLDKIADGEYSIGLALFDKGKRVEVPAEILPRYLLRFAAIHSRELNCVASFILIDPYTRGFKTLLRRLRQKQIPEFAIIDRTQEKFGIEGKSIFVFSTEENLKEKIPAVLQELHQRRIIINSMSRNLKTAIAQTHERILLSQEHARKIENIFLDKSPFGFPPVIQNFEEISDPVFRIKNREMRNLNIFRRKFSEIELDINQTLEAFERRIFVPKVASLEKYLTDIEAISEKFRCIEYELDDLGSALFNYGVSLVEAGRTKNKALINPFIFTEPYEKEAFFVDQTNLRKAAESLSEAISENLPSYFQIIQAQAGMGKTHAAQYIYAPFAERNGIKTLYIDCPLNYDFIAGIFQELTQESLYPSKLAGAIREIRRRVPSTARDLLKTIGDLTELWKAQGYNGLLLILDELENVVPYTYYEEYREKKYQVPLSLRQIRDLLAHHSILNFGILFCCRNKIYSMLKDGLKIENLDVFTFEPEKLALKDFVELINHRYEMWFIKEAPQFEEATIDELMKITNGNTRDVIKYLRELYSYAVRNKLEKIGTDTVKQVGPIPLFRY
jgi:predicted transcriptional regulator